MPVVVNYHFSQRFVLSAKDAFDWCTDFVPEDQQLMGDKNAERQIQHISERTIILKDIFHQPNGDVEKQKLVQLYPDILTWTSTHLTGPNKNSQFLYEITPQDKDASTLLFIANHLEYDEKADAKMLAEKLCKEDAAAWVLLAKAMALELGK